MKPILTKEKSLFLDNFCAKNRIISKNKLMDNAGRLSAQFFMENIKDPFNQKVLVLAGKGDNGGDAIIMHHYLRIYGVKSKLYIFNRVKLKNILKNYSISDQYILNKIDSLIIKKFSWFIDGIFGIGLNREIKSPYKEVILTLKNKNIISLDIPSGIKCDSGLPINENVFCEPLYVLSMGYLKYANVINLGKKYFKKTSVIDIDFPDILKIDKNIYTFLINHSDIKNIILEDNFQRNKYHRKATLIVGSENYSGAAFLSTSSTIKIGAGYVNSIFPGKIYKILSTIQDSIKISIGNKDNSFFSYLDYKKINISDINNPVLIGPGLGNEETTVGFIIKMLEIIKIQQNTCIIDASGFDPLYDHKLEISDLPPKCILTPHLGEFKRIFSNLDLDLTNPIICCQKIMDILDGRILILKGPSTIIVTSDRKILIINNSNSLLATAGSGDVLSGVILGLLSRGYTINEASIFGVYLHGLSSENYYNKVSKYSMTAMDIIDYLPTAFNEVF